MTNTDLQAQVNFFSGAARLFLAVLLEQARENKALRAQLEQSYSESDELAALLAKEWNLQD